MRPVLMMLGTAAAFSLDCSTTVVADSQSATNEDKASGHTAAVSVTVTPAGMRRHVAGRWATVAVNGINRSASDVEETVSVMVGDDSNLQYTRRFWIPSDSRRQAWLPIMIPEDTPGDEQHIEMTSIHLKESAGGEKFHANLLGMPTSKRSLLLSQEPSRTAAILHRRDRAEDEYFRISQLTRAIYVGRDSVSGASQDLGLVHVGTRFLPPSPTSLDSVDQVIIAGDLFLSDTLSVSRLRSWLRSGGRIWVMLDQIDPESVQRLLGDAACYSVVDRVELNAFEIERVMPQGAFEKYEPESWASETPVEMVRVLAEADEISSQIDGWPAAFWKQVGAGEILFTTLAARGWLRSSEAASNQSRPLLCYHSLSSRFFVNRIPPPRHTRMMTSLLDKEIGYQIPSRRWVGGVLGVHMLVVLVMGAWLARIRKLQRLAMVIPAAALLAAGSLVAIGNRQTSAVPSTIATIQLALAEKNSPEVKVESLAAIYSQDSRQLQIESSPETATMLDQMQPSGEIQRILWTDDGRSRWQHVTQPPGVVRYVQSDSTVSTAEPWLVTGTFSEQGFVGRVEGFDRIRCEDGVIVAEQSPALAVNFGSNSSRGFISGYEAVLPPGQFFDTKLMSDVQRDRQQLLRRLTSADTAPFGPQASLLLWTDPIPALVDFGDGFERRGDALASLPIRYQRPPRGSAFRVPASFVRLELGPGDRGGSSVFNPRTGRWLAKMNTPSESVLQCLVPRALLPCKLRRAVVAIRINAPSRALEIRGDVDGEFVTLYRKANPNGRLEFAIDRDDALELNAEGGLLVCIAVTATEEEQRAIKPSAQSVYDIEDLREDAATDQGEPASPEQHAVPSRSTWQIEYVHVHLEGITR